MLFSVTNRATGGSTHCGVLEFIADEGHVYMPYWVRFPKVVFTFKLSSNDCRDFHFLACQSTACH